MPSMGDVAGNHPDATGQRCSDTAPTGSGPRLPREDGDITTIAHAVTRIYKNFNAMIHTYTLEYTPKLT